MNALGLPGTRLPASVTWTLDRNVAAFQNLLGGTVQRVARTGDLWNADLQWPPLTGNDAGVLAAFLDQASRGDSWFYLSPPQNSVRGNWNPPELITNGKLKTDDLTGWTLDAAGAATVNARRLKIIGSANGAYQLPACEISKPYILMADVDGYGSPVMGLQVYRSDGVTLQNSLAFTPPARALLTFTPLDATCKIRVFASTGVGYFGNVSAARCLLVNGGGQVGNVLNVKGGPTSINGAIFAGEFVMVRVAGLWQLLRLIDDFDSDANGKGTLRFEPALRYSPIDGENIIVRNPFVRALIPQQTNAVNTTPGNIVGIRLGAKEDNTAVSGEIQSSLIWAWDCESLGLAPAIGTGTPTFTGQNGTFVGSNGLIQNAAVNAPRLDYDPVTLAIKGLLIEESRTNGLTFSADESQGTAQNAITLALNALAAPDGTTTATKLQETAVANEHSNSRTSALPTTTASTLQALSVFVKSAERTWCHVSTVNRDGAVWRTWFNLGTGTFGTINANHTVAAQAYPSGWYKLTVVFNSGAAAGALQFAIGIATGDTVLSYTGTAGSGIYVWGRQWEADKSFATSYIPTTTAAVTRTADLCSIATSAITGFSASAGSIFVEMNVPSFNASNPAPFVMDDGTGNQTISGYVVAANGNVGLNVVNGGVSQANFSTPSIAVNTNAKMAWAYAASNFSISVNGAAAATALSGTVPVVTTLRLGNTSNGVQAVDGWLRRIRIYNTRLGNSQLQALSMP